MSSQVYIGRYRVIEELGRGGMGIVYKGEDPELERLVAIKVLPPKKLSQAKAIKRFLREARVSARLDHTNIIRIFDIGEEEGIYHIVMELAEGRSLREHIEERENIQQIDIDHMADIFLQTCRALDYAHKQKIVHRDIKPDNIMVTIDGMVKVMDFGLAVLEDHHSLTEMGQVMGTIAYFSPEQAKGEAVDHRADIYSLGIVFFEMLTNQLVFHATNPSEMIAKHLSSPPPNPRSINPGIPPALVNLILMCLKKRPEERIQSVEEMIRIIETWQNTKKMSSSLSQPFTKKEDPGVPPARRDEPREHRSPEMLKSLARGFDDYQDKNGSQDQLRSLARDFDNSLTGTQGSYDDLPPYRAPSVEEPPSARPSASEEKSPLKRPVFNRPPRLEEPSPPPPPPPGLAPVASSLDYKSEPDFRDKQKPPLQFDRTEEMVTRIPAPSIKPEPQKPPSYSPTSGDSPVASSQWMAEAGNTNMQWNRYQHVLDQMKKDDSRQADLRKTLDQTICPKCGAENEHTRKYCHECGQLLSQSQFLSQKEAQVHHETGKELLLEKKYQEASEEFEKAVSMDPTLTLAYFFLGEAYQGAGEFKKARATYREYARLVPDDIRPYVNVGDMYRMEKRREDAIYSYREALKLEPSNIRIRNQVALLYSQMGNIDSAIDEYQRILSVEPENVETHRQLAYMYMARERNEEAIREFEWLLSMDPEDKQVYQILGNLYIKVGRLSKAEQVYQTCLTINPEDPEAMANLGEIYQKQNREDLALMQLHQAIQVDNTNVDARQKLADIYLKHNRADLAVSELENAIKFQPENPEVHQKLGDIYLQSRQIDKALLHFEKVVMSEPESAEMHHKLAKLYLKKDHSELSVNQFKKAVTLEPYNPTYREDLGMALYAQNKIPDAITELRKAATLDSTNIEYQKALGIMYEESNQLDMAEKTFQKVIQMNPRDSMGYGMLGRVYSKRGLMSMAIYNYQKALMLNPDSHLFNVYLGKALAQQGRTKEAVDYFKRAIELAPGGSSAKGTRILAKVYSDLGRVYLEQGDLNKALDVLKSAEENNPNDPQTIHYLGILYLDTNKLDKALEYLSKAIKLQPMSAEVMRDLSALYLAKKEYTLAVSMVKKAILHAPAELEGYEILAKILQKMNRIDDAHQALQDALKINPQMVDYIYWLHGNLSRENKDWDLAIDYYRKAILENDTDWRYNRDLSSVYEEKKDYQQAINELGIAVSKAPGEKEVETLQKEIARLQKKKKSFF